LEYFNSVDGPEYILIPEDAVMDESIDRSKPMALYLHPSRMYSEEFDDYYINGKKYHNRTIFYY